MSTHQFVLPRIQKLVDDFADEITTSVISTRPLDPKLYTRAQFPIVNIYESPESWTYRGSQQTERRYAVQIEMYMLIWDADTPSGQAYWQRLLKNLRTALHTIPTDEWYDEAGFGLGDFGLGPFGAPELAQSTGCVALSLAIQNTSPDQGEDNYPRYRLEVLLEVLNVDQYPNG